MYLIILFQYNKFQVTRRFIGLRSLAMHFFFQRQGLPGIDIFACSDLEASTSLLLHAVRLN